jgi:hypothetical protein
MHARSVMARAILLLPLALRVVRIGAEHAEIPNSI